jgi:Tetracyclin repressor-like, C-terminal domain
LTVPPALRLRDADEKRTGLEQVARRQWAIYQDHPWLARTMSFSRPLLAPNAMRHTERMLAVLDGQGLDDGSRLHIAITLANYARGTAVNLESERVAQQDTGLSREQWFESQSDWFRTILATGQYPQFAALTRGPDIYLGLDSFFEFGLQRMLDGVEALIGRAGGAPS